MNYYETLEVSPEATQAEIKSAYYRLSKELHPDKLHPDTPERARKIVEEQYKQINEAYDTLSDPDKRREYHQQIYSQNRNSCYYTQSENNVNVYTSAASWFNEAELQYAAEALKARLENIEKDANKVYIERIERIEKELKLSAFNIGYKREIQSIESITDKSQATNTGIILIFVGIVLVVIPQWLIGLAGVIVLVMGVIHIIKGIQIDPNHNKRILIAKKLYQKSKAKRFEAEQQKNNSILRAKNEISGRIKHFQSLHFSRITRDFFVGLSSEDQVLLLVAIHLANEQASQEMKELASLALRVGAVAALLGFGLLFGN